MRTTRYLLFQPRPRVPQSLSGKTGVAKRALPLHQVAANGFCGVKTIVSADIMIDDHFKNLDHFAGTTFLYSQPHNVKMNNGKHKRVQNWLEIASILL